MEYAGRITVEDVQGKRFQVHEFRGRRFLKRVRKFVLESGEAVRKIDFDNYEVGNGRRLVRIDGS